MGENFDVSNTDWSSIKVLVVGAGGLGCELLHCLALSGFRDIHVIDMDTIDLSNLNRQFLFRNDDIGKPKADVAAAFVNKRCPWVEVTPHFSRIEEKPTDFYRQFNIVILGLDSIHARTWINAMYASLAKREVINGEVVVTESVPLIDGGTEGFKGSARVIQFGRTACIQCTLYLFPPQRGVPMCTLENVPRVPAHCVLYVKEKTWGEEKPFGASADGQALPLDGDNPQHIQWIMEKAKLRQERFQLAGTIDFAFTQGVVKNVIPAVGFTNAMVAAMCVNEALKMATDMATTMDCFAFYDGSKAGVASSVNQMLPDPTCPVCQCTAVELDKSWTPQQAISHILNSQKTTIEHKFHVTYPENWEQQLDAQMSADVGESIPLLLRGPLAYKTEPTKNQPILQTLEAETQSKQLFFDRKSLWLVLNGGPILGNHELVVLASFK